VRCNISRKLHVLGNRSNTRCMPLTSPWYTDRVAHLSCNKENYISLTANCLRTWWVQRGRFFFLRLITPQVITLERSKENYLHLHYVFFLFSLLSSNVCLFFLHMFDISLHVPRCSCVCHPDCLISHNCKSNAVQCA